MLSCFYSTWISALCVQTWCSLLLPQAHKFAGCSAGMMLSCFHQNIKAFESDGTSVWTYQHTRCFLLSVANKLLWFPAGMTLSSSSTTSMPLSLRETSVWTCQRMRTSGSSCNCIGPTCCTRTWIKSSLQFRAGDSLSLLLSCCNLLFDLLLNDCWHEGLPVCFSAFKLASASNQANQGVSNLIWIHRDSTFL